MFDRLSQPDEKQETQGKGATLRAPSITLPKGGGAIRGIGEKFGANPVTGTGSISVPIATSPGRSFPVVWMVLATNGWTSMAKGDAIAH